jgi:dipeptidyl-peptidase-4
MLVPGDPTYPKVRETRFARVGGVIPSLKVGVVGCRRGETNWLSVSTPDEGTILGRSRLGGELWGVAGGKRERPRASRHEDSEEIQWPADPSVGVSSGGALALDRVF